MKMWSLMKVLLLLVPIIASCRLMVNPPETSMNGAFLKTSLLPMTMVETSYDDTYKGCEKEMEKEVIEELLSEELENNDMYNTCWDKAEKAWNEKKKTIFSKCTTLKDIYATAIMTYTMDGKGTKVYSIFNKATREAGRSLKDYQEYPFKSLHFLLTRAATLLKTCKWKRREVYRGARIEFSAQKGDVVRFGQFTSTSVDRRTAEMFAEKTLFIIRDTQYGYPLKNFSFLSHEKEVLIPPYEMFSVVTVEIGRSVNTITLKSKGKCSYWKCKRMRAKDDPKLCPKHTVLLP